MLDLYQELEAVNLITASGFVPVKLSMKGNRQFALNEKKEIRVTVGRRFVYFYSTVSSDHIAYLDTGDIEGIKKTIEKIKLKP
ncbi:MAG: hypothetical protein M0Z57_01810 [Deltaproteobacteria bacterium]|jgi:hypothetical protein|nr:hypothetical protein [Deltaproteobacteria bacterium]